VNFEASTDLRERANIRMSGLGGQGLVTAATLLGMAAVSEGRFSTVVPFFGAEKRLAPTESYVRIASERIHECGEVTYPDVIVVFHADVIVEDKCFTMPFYSGFRKGGWLVINSETPVVSDRDLARLEALEAHIVYVPAAQIARDVAGTELASNMAILGALAGATGVATLAGLEAALAQRFGAEKFIASGTTAVLDDVLRRKYSRTKELIDKNMASIRTAFDMTKSPER